MAPVIPIVVGGYLLARPSDSGNTDEIMSQVGFNHPEKYDQIQNGKGTDSLTVAVQGWKKSIAQDFDDVKQLLDDANKQAGLAWQGQAAEAHGNKLGPMTSFIEDAKHVSEGVGKASERQIDNFGTVKHSMPEPVKVDATDSYLEKGAAFVFGQETDLQKQEAQATAQAEEAKRHYDNYDASTRDVSSSLPQYPAAPEMAYDQGSGTPGQGGYVPSGMGPGSGGSAQPVGGGSGSGLTGGSGAGFSDGSGGGSGSSVSPGGYAGSPAGSGSAWANPGTPGVPGPGAPGTPTPGGPGSGPGGPGLVPGAGIGPGAGSGTGRGGMGAGGRAGGGLGAGGSSGAGRGAGALGAGGRAGAVGGVPGAAGAGGRGGAAGAMGGAGARGRGQDDEEDGEHENKYMLPTDEAWDELGLPAVAPPVFGDWGADNR